MNTAGIRKLHITGGGAYKFSELYQSHSGLDVTVDKKDEMRCLITGLNYVLKYVPEESFWFEDVDSFKPIKKVLKQVDSDYLLVNVGTYARGAARLLMPQRLGTGVSILKVSSNGNKFERVSGSALGGGTYWGLARLLTRVKDFKQSMELATQGKSENVDMTVGDIYGGDYNQLKLPKNMTASFFGKMIAANDDERPSDADVCAALLMMVTNNVGQIAYLNALKYNTAHVLFSGNFLRGNKISQSALARSLHFWSGGNMKALFMKHEGYFGSLGCLLESQDSSDAAQSADYR